MAVDLVVSGVKKVEMYLTGIVVELEDGTRLNRKELSEYQNKHFAIGKNETFYDATLGNVKVYYATHFKQNYDGVVGYLINTDISDMVP
jgi:hypothetical protein